MVVDDLVIQPMSTISSITLLNKFNIKEVGALQEKVVELGMTQVWCQSAQGFSPIEDGSDMCFSQDQFGILGI
ncbi:hypothetical protein E2542_SST30521 [Spatholobus suberectus]|nr:hypothetical protein E2542_SST30521 [Spatholobus suberectus]